MSMMAFLFRRRSAYRQVFDLNTNDGPRLKAVRYVISDLKRACQYDAPIMHADARVEAYRLGLRAAFLHIKKTLDLTDEDIMKTDTEKDEP